jgi:hypothetical protein
MDGAGSVIAANHIYNKASRDGLTVGVFDAHNIFNHMMGDPSLRIDGRKFLWIGTPSKDSVACAIMGFTGLKSFDDIVKSQKPVKMGATREGELRRSFLLGPQSCGDALWAILADDWRVMTAASRQGS